ncbi:MAG: hypothetical protein ABSA45_11070 [Verrucomicrobiota bacterium]
MLGRNHALKQLTGILNNGFVHSGASASRLRFGSVEQPQQSRLGLLFDRKHLAEIGLGRDQSGLFRLLGGLIFRQQVFDLRGRRIVINCLLQRFGSRVSRLAKGAWTAIVAAAAAAAAEQPGHAAHISGGTLGVHHFLDEWLDRAPVGVVGDAELILDALHYTLLHLRRIEIAASSATTTATTATTVILREDAVGAQHQSGGYSANS